MRKRSVLLSKMVALLIAFLLLLVPMVAHTSEGDVLVGLAEIDDDGFMGIQPLSICLNCNATLCEGCGQCTDVACCQSGCLEFSWDTFNNGPLGDPSRPNESLANAGLIRMWTQVNEVNESMPLHVGGTITAVCRDTGDCAMYFVTIRRIWIDGTGWINYFNLIDVRKDDFWEFIYLTIVPFECHEPVTFLLHNGNFVPPGHTVTFVVQNGAGPPNVYLPQTSSIQVPDGGLIPANAIPNYNARRGFYFAGWYLGEEPSWVPYHPGDYGPVTGDRTFTARFNELWWYIVFYVEEGGVHEGRTQYRYRDGQRVYPGTWAPLPTIPNTDARPGWKFVGWEKYDPVEGWIEYDPATVTAIYYLRYDLTRNITFRARFEPIEPIKPTIEKAASPAYPAIVNPGGIVTYTITVDRGDMDVDGFRNLRVVDGLHELLRLNLGSIEVAGVDDFEYSISNNVITIYNMELSYCDVNVYVDQVVITFTATVVETAQSGVRIPNVAYLWCSEIDDAIGYDGDFALVYDERLGQGTITFQVTKVWAGDENYLDERPEYVTIELRRPNQIAPVSSPVTLDADNNWTYIWSGLEAESNGIPIVYYVVEINVPDNYLPSYLYDRTRVAEGYIFATVTNTFIPEDDDDNNDIDPERERDGRGRRGPLTGDFAADVPLFAGLLFAMSSVLGGASLKKVFRRK